MHGIGLYSIRSVDLPYWVDMNFYIMPVPMRRLQANPSGRILDRSLKLEVFVRDEFACVECGDIGTDLCPLHLDHFLSLRAGGSNHPDNLQALCRRHNLLKGALFDAKRPTVMRYSARIPSPRPNYVQQ